MDQVAERLHKSRRWLQDFLRGRDIGRLAGRTKLFTDADILRLIEALPCPSSSSRRASRRTGRSAARISGGTLTEALALASERSPPKCSKGSSGKSNVVPMPSREKRHSRAQQRAT
jgi:hypothetical protein